MQESIKRPKTKLGLPDLDHSKSAVLDSLRSPESKRGYRHAIDEFIQWYCSEPRLSFNKVVVTRYRIFLENRQLAAGTINGRLAAVRRLAYEAADAGLLSPELAAGIRRVKGARKLGVRLGNWLTTDEARKLWQAPDPDTLKGKRDQAILAILLGCGLRRLRLFGQLQELPVIDQSRSRARTSPRAIHWPARERSQHPCSPMLVANRRSLATGSFEGISAKQMIGLTENCTVQSTHISTLSFSLANPTSRTRMLPMPSNSNSSPACPAVRKPLSRTS